MVSFLHLPHEIRTKIYRQVLIIRHPLYLFQDPGCSVGAFAPDRPVRWLALLYINKQLHYEASTVLYSMNRFYFVDISQRQIDTLGSFLRCIGPTNAASLSFLCLNFPIVEERETIVGDLKIRNESQQCLTLLQQQCGRLSTLELVVHYKNYHFFAKADEFLQRALPYIDKQLRTLPSLDKVIVRIEVHGQIPKPLTKELMQELGWLVSSSGRP